MIAALGAAANAEDITNAFEALRSSAEAYVEALKAAANAEMERLSSEAEFIKWLGQTDSAIESAAGALRSFADSLRSFADSLRSFADSLRSFADSLRSFAQQARDLITEGRSEDREFLQRQYLSAKLAYASIRDETGDLRGDISQQRAQDVINEYLSAARSLQGAIGEYDYTGKSALERELLQAADAIDLSADILSVRIVGDNVDLATNQTINDLIAALTPALSIDQIGFTGTSDAAKRALALTSGAKTQTELDALIEAIATLRFGDDASDAAYLDNLARLAEYDDGAARQTELLQNIIELLAHAGAISAEQLKRLDKIERHEARAELVAEAGAGA